MENMSMFVHDVWLSWDNLQKTLLSLRVKSLKVDFPLNGPLKLEVHSVAKTHTWAIPKNLEEVPCQYQIFTILGEAYNPSILNQGIPGLNNKHLSIGLIPWDLWSDLKKIYPPVIKRGWKIRKNWALECWAGKISSWFSHKTSNHDVPIEPAIHRWCCPVIVPSFSRAKLHIFMVNLLALRTPFSGKLRKGTQPVSPVRCELIVACWQVQRRWTRWKAGWFLGKVGNVVNPTISQPPSLPWFFINDYKWLVSTCKHHPQMIGLLLWLPH